MHEKPDIDPMTALGVALIIGTVMILLAMVFR